MSVGSLCCYEEQRREFRDAVCGGLSGLYEGAGDSSGWAGGGEDGTRLVMERGGVGRVGVHA